MTEAEKIMSALRVAQERFSDVQSIDVVRTTAIGELAASLRNLQAINRETLAAYQFGEFIPTENAIKQVLALQDDVVEHVLRVANHYPEFSNLFLSDERIHDG